MDVELLRKLYRVDSSSPSGVVFNGSRRRGTAKDGLPALATKKAKSNGGVYYQSSYTDCTGGTKVVTSLMAHRVVFALVYGYLPETVDHKDGNTLNNDPLNLRAATQQEQTLNRMVMKNSKLGLKGVVALPNGTYRAQICHKGKRESLGIRSTAEEAAALYLQRSNELHGEFSIGNRDV